MAILDKPTPAPATLAQDLYVVLKRLRGAVQGFEGWAQDARTLVKRHGRSNVIAALGADAAELLALYGDLKTFLDTHMGGSIPEFPNQ